VLLTVELTAWAQDYPKMEVAVNYSFVNFVPATVSNAADLNGGGGQFTYNFTKFLGIKADFQGYGSHAATVTVPAGPNVPRGPFSVTANGNLFTYLFGPQIKYHGKFAPFVEVLFGAAHSNVYSDVFKAAPAGSFVGSVNPSNNGFAMAAGGGLDIKVARVVAIRLAEFDYLLTRFGNPITHNNPNQNSFRYNAGVVFQF
jgi:opacity protein-like surface antigen